jgi:hypothetical protein
VARRSKPKPKRKPAATATSTGWNVYRISGNANRYIGDVMGKDEGEAIKNAMKELTIAPALRNRILVKPNE